MINLNTLIVSIVVCVIFPLIALWRYEKRIGDDDVLR